MWAIASLGGGVNSSNYAEGNPLINMDKYGLDADSLGVVVYDGTYAGGLLGSTGNFDIGLYDQ